MDSRNFLTGYPPLCGAETGAFGCLPSASVQHLATIAHGDVMRTMHVIAPSLVDLCNGAFGTAADTTTESGGISA